MNFVGRQSLHLDNVNKPTHFGAQERCFGRDITNMLGGNVLGKGSIKHKRATSQYVPAKVAKAQTNIVEQYESEHFKILAKEDQLPVFSGLMGITPKMRSILVDWLVDVHCSFNLNQKTLHYGFRLLDIYLSKKQASRSDLQLVGITCLWIASKYEEIYPPRLKSFVDITANTYKSTEMIEMEIKILETLDFNLVLPTAYNFIEIIGMAGKSRSIALYLSELSTLEGLSLKFKQATIALAALSLSDHILKTKTEAKELIGLVNSNEMVECFKQMCKLLSEPNKYGLKAITRKFSSAEWHNSSKIQLETHRKQ